MWLGKATRGPTSREIGKTLRLARVRAGLTRIDAAKHLGVTRFSLYHWERGSRTPGLVNYFRALKLYGILDTLLERLKDPGSSSL